MPDFYREQYVRAPAVRSPRVPIDLRRSGQLSVVVIPERFPGGALTPCAYIRLLQPLDHADIAGDFNIVLSDDQEALQYRADVFVTQRYAVEELDTAEALIRHCRDHNITLLYDLDDDLRHIPREHPDSSLLRPKGRLVSRMVRDADAVWVSTPALAASLTDLRDDVRVVENGLDERLWAASPPPTPPRQGPVRILFMGTATHDADFALVQSALLRVKTVFGERVSVELLGVSSRNDLPFWVHRVGMPVNATASYPGFVNWLTQQHWDIAIAPLADTPFNRCKSSIKTLDYAALGLPVLASDCVAYRGSLADGPAGMLLPDDETAWFVALARLVRDAPMRRRMSAAARAAFPGGTLAAQADARRAAWLALTRPPERLPRPAERRTKSKADREPAAVG